MVARVFEGVARWLLSCCLVVAMVSLDGCNGVARWLL